MLAPIEPGARTLCEPWLTGPRLKLWRLIPPWKPLPIEIPATLTFWPASKDVDGDVVADLGALLGAEVLVAELDQVAHRRGAGLLQVAFLGLAQLALLDLAEGELDGGVAVALGLADRGHLAGAGLDHGHRDDLAVLAEDLRHAQASCRGSRPWS